MDSFVRADSTNLPKLSNIMILEYMASSDKHNVAEIRGAKVIMSSRDSYVDTAVGFVEVKRSCTECITKAKVVPEHRVSNKQYVVSVTIKEQENVITEVTCDGCAASAGGCKHGLVFLFWLEKRSAEPASTSTQCYWKKPQLSNVRTEPVLSENIFEKSKKIKLDPADSNVAKNFLAECKNHDVGNSLATCFKDNRKSYNIFDMSIEYLEANGDADNFEQYKTFINSHFTEAVINEINVKTKDQVNSKTWHEVRQGRITASKLYEASRCSTDGTLVQQILGGYKVPETKAINRGKRLEADVLVEVEKLLGKKINKSGFVLINGLVGASPDGVGDDFIVEIKCPASNNSVKNYVCDNKVHPKFVAQMQAQMLATGKKKAVFCVADPLFEQNKNVSLYWLDYDEGIMQDLLNKALGFWKQYIYKKVLSSASIK